MVDTWITSVLYGLRARPLIARLGVHRGRFLDYGSMQTVDLVLCVKLYGISIPLLIHMVRVGDACNWRCDDSEEDRPKCRFFLEALHSCNWMVSTRLYQHELFVIAGLDTS